MPGFSITLLLLPEKFDLLLSLLDEKVDAPAWRRTSDQPPQAPQPSLDRSNPVTLESSKFPTIPANNPGAFERRIRQACNAIVTAEPEITKMDTIAGDGDCGLTLRSGATGDHPSLLFSIGILIITCS